MRPVIKRRIKIIIALVLCSLFLYIFKLNIVYGFKPIEKKFSWGRVGAVLDPPEDVHLLWTIRKGSYYFGVWFDSDIQGVVQIKELELLNARTKKAVLSEVHFIEKPFKKQTYSQKFMAYYSFKDLKLEYTDMMLKIRFFLKQNNKIVEYETELPLKTNFRVFFSPPSV